MTEGLAEPDAWFGGWVAVVLECPLPSPPIGTIPPLDWWALISAMTLVLEYSLRMQDCSCRTHFPAGPFLAGFLSLVQIRSLIEHRSQGSVPEHYHKCMPCNEAGVAHLGSTDMTCIASSLVLPDWYRWHLRDGIGVRKHRKSDRTCHSVGISDVGEYNIRGPQRFVRTRPIIGNGIRRGRPGRAELAHYANVTIIYIPSPRYYRSFRLYGVAMLVSKWHVRHLCGTAQVLLSWL